MFKKILATAASVLAMDSAAMASEQTTAWGMTECGNGQAYSFFVQAAYNDTNANIRILGSTAGSGNGYNLGNKRIRDGVVPIRIQGHKGYLRFEDDGAVVMGGHNECPEFRLEPIDVNIIASTIPQWHELVGIEEPTDDDLKKLIQLAYKRPPLFLYQDSDQNVVRGQLRDLDNATKDFLLRYIDAAAKRFAAEPRETPEQQEASLAKLKAFTEGYPVSLKQTNGYNVFFEGPRRFSNLFSERMAKVEQSQRVLRGLEPVSPYGADLDYCTMAAAKFSRGDRHADFAAQIGLPGEFWSEEMAQSHNEKASLCSDRNFFNATSLYRETPGYITSARQIIDGYAAYGADLQKFEGSLRDAVRIGLLNTPPAVQEANNIRFRKSGFLNPKGYYETLVTIPALAMLERLDPPLDQQISDYVSEGSGAAVNGYDLCQKLRFDAIKSTNDLQSMCTEQFIAHNTQQITEAFDAEIERINAVPVTEEGAGSIRQSLTTPHIDDFLDSTLRNLVVDSNGKLNQAIATKEGEFFTLVDDFYLKVDNSVAIADTPIGMFCETAVSTALIAVCEKASIDMEDRRWVESYDDIIAGVEQLASDIKALPASEEGLGQLHAMLDKDPRYPSRSALARNDAKLNGLAEDVKTAVMAKIVELKPVIQASFDSVDAQQFVELDYVKSADVDVVLPQFTIDVCRSVQDDTCIEGYESVYARVDILKRKALIEECRPKLAALGLSDDDAVKDLVFTVKGKSAPGLGLADMICLDSHMSILPDGENGKVKFMFGDMNGISGTLDASGETAVLRDTTIAPMITAHYGIFAPIGIGCEISRGLYGEACDIKEPRRRN